MSKIEDLEESLKAALHQKQVLDRRLDSQLKLAQEEFRKQQRLHKQEMEAVVARKQQLEKMNRHLLGLEFRFSVSLMRKSQSKSM